MELNREQEQITNANNDLYEYVKRIVAAVKYKGGCDHEDVPSILREFAEGYEQKIKELTEENERLITESAKEFTCAFASPHKVADCPLPDEVAKAKADTARKMQEELVSEPLPFFVYEGERLVTCKRINDVADKLLREVE